MTKNKVMSYLGLATRARKVQSGEFSTEKSVKSGRAALVMVAEDASDNTKRSLQICVPFIKCLFIFMVRKRHWELPLGKNFEPL